MKQFDKQHILSIKMNMVSKKSTYFNKALKFLSTPEWLENS